MRNEFERISKKLWFGDKEAIRLVKALRREDRETVEQRLLSLYGVSIDLSVSEEEIKAALAAAQGASGEQLFQSYRLGGHHAKR